MKKFLRMKFLSTHALIPKKTEFGGITVDALLNIQYSQLEG